MFGMSFNDEVEGYLQEIKEENENFKKAQTPEEEIEALKEMMDGFMRAAQSTREKIDRYNDRRWQR
jgi:uncharacterized coiled-coil DUF342 family protein